MVIIDQSRTCLCQQPIAKLTEVGSAMRHLPFVSAIALSIEQAHVVLVLARSIPTPAPICNGPQ